MILFKIFCFVPPSPDTIIIPEGIEMNEGIKTVTWLGFEVSYAVSRTTVWLSNSHEEGQCSRCQTGAVGGEKKDVFLYTDILKKKSIQRIRCEIIEIVRRVAPPPPLP